MTEKENKNGAATSNKSHRNMTLLDTVLAFFATSLGAGLLSVPFALWTMGLVFGPIFIIMIALMSHLSMVMYVETQELMPVKTDSIYEIAYLMYGRCSIFVICTLLSIGNFVGVIMFYILIGDSISHLIEAYITDENDSRESEE